MGKFGIFVREIYLREEKKSTYDIEATDKRSALAAALHRFYGSKTVATGRHVFATNDNALHIAFNSGKVATAEIKSIKR